MEELNYKRSSWHYWLATKLGPMQRWDDATDFCTYVRAVVVGMLMFCLLSCLGLGLLYCFGDWLGWISAMIKAGHIIWLSGKDPSGAMIFNVVLGVCAGIGGFGGGMYWREQANHRKAERIWQAKQELGANYVPPEPSFIGHAWKRFKDKTCYKVKFN
jgi:hypothetical protein